MENRGLASVLQMDEGTGALTLEEIMEHRITDEYLSLLNLDGSMRKTSKCTLANEMDLQPLTQPPKQYIGIVDKGLIWHLATPTADDREEKKRDGSDYKWGDYLEKIGTII